MWDKRERGGESTVHKRRRTRIPRHCVIHAENTFRERLSRLRYHRDYGYFPVAAPATLLILMYSPSRVSFPKREFEYRALRAGRRLPFVIRLCYLSRLRIINRPGNSELKHRTEHTLASAATLQITISCTYYSVHNEREHAYYERRSSYTLTPDYQSAFYCTLSRELLWCRAITFLLRRVFLLPFIAHDNEQSRLRSGCSVYQHRPWIWRLTLCHLSLRYADGRQFSN